MQLTYAWKQAWYMIPVAIFGGILTAFLLSRRRPSSPLDMLKNALALSSDLIFSPSFPLKITS